MNARFRSASAHSAAANSLVSPIQKYLKTLHASLAGENGGEVASYIPELGQADPSGFGIAIATTDGEIYAVGDTDQNFTIQSVSKPFMYGYALREYEKEFVLSHVGVEPTGEAFNSIILDDVNNRPFNPMVNAGAIAVAELMKGDDAAERERNMLELFSQFAGRALDIDKAVFHSENETGHRNRAIAYMMLNTGMIQRPPEDVLDLYFKQCSLRVTCKDLAIMGATLANDGVNPVTGKTVIQPQHVRDVLTLMNSCGMYNYAGQWAYEVGLPAKSGVSGGIVAVIPGQIGVAVYSPLLDPHGNSVRGVQVCKKISEEFGLHVFNSHTSVISVIRREYRGNTVHSKRLRTPREWNTLAQEGNRIAVVELQGALFFGSVERLIRRIGQLSEEVDFVIVDFKRVQLADVAARTLIQNLAVAAASLDCRLALTHLTGNGLLARLHRELERIAGSADILLLADTDEGLERFEDIILEEMPDHRDLTKFALSELDIFRGLNSDEYRLLEDIVQPLHFQKGDVIIREGDPASLFFVVARGSVSVSLSMDGERRKRIACIGPGLSFGEMALLDGGQRSADVVADEAVICYGLSVDCVRELAKDHPNILITILGNLTRDFSDRLRRANDEIRTLE